MIPVPIVYFHKKLAENQAKMLISIYIGCFFEDMQEI